jgi:hypothetical protein
MPTLTENAPSGSDVLGPGPLPLPPSSTRTAASRSESGTWTPHLRCHLRVARSHLPSERSRVPIVLRGCDLVTVELE